MYHSSFLVCTLHHMHLLLMFLLWNQLIVYISRHIYLDSSQFFLLFYCSLKYFFVLTFIVLFEINQHFLLIWILLLDTVWLLLLHWIFAFSKSQKMGSKNRLSNFWLVDILLVSRYELPVWKYCFLKLSVCMCACVCTCTILVQENPKIIPSNLTKFCKHIWHD